jgi:hypothetical protein
MEQILAEDALSSHSRHSVLRERIVEHVFVADVLRRLWQLGITDAEVLRSEFDAGGYDIVLSRGRITRHIQLKTLTAGGRASEVKVGLALAEKPSGCVLWIVVSPDLETESYLWFGAEPGAALPDISLLKMAKHTKGNAQGEKSYRPNHRLLPRRKFTRLNSIDEVLDKLLGIGLATATASR